MGAPELFDRNVATGAPVGTLGGTTNTIPRWTGPSTLGDSILVQNSTALVTAGSSSATQTTFRVRTVGTANNAPAFSLYRDGVNEHAIWAGSGTIRLGFALDPAGYTDAQLLAATRMGIDPSGNVGIGTATPLSYANYVSLTIGDNNAAKTGILKFRSTYNGGNGAEIFQSTAGVLTISANGSRSIMAAQNTGGTDSAAQVAIGTSSFTSGCSLTVTQSIDASQSGQGLKLPATPGNADTQTLDCYLDGGASGGATWTPVDNSGAGLTLTVTSARYLRVGRLVVASFDITFPATASVVQAKISLPVTAQAVWQGASIGFGPNVPGLTAAVNNADLNFWTYGAATTNAALSGARLIVSMSYFAN